MVVSTTEGGDKDKVLSLGSSSGDLFEDHKKALRFYPIVMGAVRDSVVPIVIYTMFLSLELLLAVVVASMIDGKYLTLMTALRLFVGAFIVMIVFFFVAGYIYKMTLDSILDTSYISYVYVVAFSLTYYPIMMFLARISGENLGIIFVMISALISQFFVESSMLSEHNFDSNRKRFMFSLAVFALQWGFAFLGFSLILSVSSLK